MIVAQISRLRDFGAEMRLRDCGAERLRDCGAEMRLRDFTHAVRDSDILFLTNNQRSMH